MSRSAVPAGPSSWNALVPELVVSDLPASLAFWRDLLGFRVVYERPADGFAFIEREGAQFMLEALAPGSWRTADLARPFGRGLHFEIAVRSLAPLLDAHARAHWPLWRPVEERWYRVGDHEVGQRQFLTQDPDGYLLRFAEPMGTRAPT